MKDIISISGKAENKIKKKLSLRPKNVEGIVAGVDKTDCSGYKYKIDYSTNDNTKNFNLFESKGMKVYFESKATVFLIGSEMDYSIDKLSSRFVFNNLNEKSSCGCGESFKI